MDILQKIRSSYAGLVERGVFERSFERWACEQTALGEFRDVAEVVEVCAKHERSAFSRFMRRSPTSTTMPPIQSLMCVRMARIPLKWQKWSLHLCRARNTAE